METKWSFTVHHTRAAGLGSMNNAPIPIGIRQGTSSFFSGRALEFITSTMSTFSLLRPPASLLRPSVTVAPTSPAHSAMASIARCARAARPSSALSAAFRHTTAARPISRLNVARAFSASAISTSHPTLGRGRSPFAAPFCPFHNHTTHDTHTHTYTYTHISKP